jgi:hypothetical protein
MGFRFRVVKIWQFNALSTVHAIGELVEGNILPPVVACVLERDGQTVQVESIALSRSHIANREK